MGNFLIIGADFMSALGDGLLYNENRPAPEKLGGALQEFLKVRNHVMLSAVLQARSISNFT
jgi:hypothetical protein